MEPSYAAVMEAIEACGLSATMDIANADSSYLGHVGEMLRMQPLQRLRRLGGEKRAEQALRLAVSDVDGVLFGDIAAALQGWPLMLPLDAQLELCSAEAVQHPGGVVVVERPPGTRGLGDLRRHRERIAIAGDDDLWVAAPLDLLRIERARRRYVQAGALAAVVEHRRRWPGGPPPPRDYTEVQAAEAIEAWLARGA